MSEFASSLDDVLESHMEEFGESTGVVYGYEHLATPVSLWAILGKISSELVEDDRGEYRVFHRDITISAVEAHTRYGGVANVRDDGWFDVSNDSAMQFKSTDVVRWSIVEKVGTTDSFHTFRCKVVRRIRAARSSQQVAKSLR